jgi:hypothetical protein
MSIPRMYTIALQAFGYTEAEANFLYLVATHSGYFTCQQFVRFIDGKPGKRTLSFVRKVLERGHATARPCLRNGKLYHLFARNLYEAIGKDNVRFRRKHSPEYIRTRLAAFDFILGRLNFHFLETEDEKVRLFTEQLGIDKKYLPAKRYLGAISEGFTDRYFVDKFPMYVRPTSSSPPVVSFSFVDAGLESIDSFKTYLEAYTPLFLQLRELNLHYIATRETHQNRAKRLFMDLFERHWNPDSPGGIVDYFCLRKQAETTELHKLSSPDLAALSLAKARFNRPEIEALYQKWRSGERHFQQVRDEYYRLRRPRSVSFTFSPVNGQIALFERHPASLVKTPWKSARKTDFPGDFTHPVTQAES